MSEQTASDAQVVSLKTEATGMMQWANDLTVTQKAEADDAMQRLATIKGIRNRVVAWFAPMKKAAQDAHKAIVAREKEVTDVADRAEAIVKGKVLSWQQQERQRAEAEQLRLQAEADERARKERARLEAEAAKLKTPEKREERLQQAAAVVAPTVTVAAETASAAGTATRVTYKAVLVDLTALIAAAVPGSVAATLVTFDQRAADAMARATKGKTTVPGVRFEAVEGLSVRAG